MSRNTTRIAFIINTIVYSLGSIATLVIVGMVFRVVGCLIAVAIAITAFGLAHCKIYP